MTNYTIHFKSGQTLNITEEQKHWIETKIKEGSKKFRWTDKKEYPLEGLRIEERTYSLDEAIKPPQTQAAKIQTELSKKRNTLIGLKRAAQRHLARFGTNNNIMAQVRGYEAEIVKLERQLSTGSAIQSAQA